MKENIYEKVIAAALLKFGKLDNMDIHIICKNIISKLDNEKYYCMRNSYNNLCKFIKINSRASLGNDNICLREDFTFDSIIDKDYLLNKKIQMNQTIDEYYYDGITLRELLERFSNEDVIKEYFANYYLYNSDITFDFTAENRMTIHNNVAEPWKVTLVDTGLNTMTGGRIKRVKDYIGDEPFMLTYGDGVSDVDINKLVEFHKSHGKMATISVCQPNNRFGVVDIGENNEIKDFREKTKEDGDWINAGFMVLEPEIIDLIDEGDSCVGQNFTKKQKFLAKVFYTYSGKIDFDKSIEDVARRSINSTDGIQIDLGLGEKRIDDIVISGVVSKLRVYAQTVIDRKTTTEKTDKKPIIINNNATANATVINNNAIDLSVVFQNARQKVDDEGLSDLQTKEITEKLNELEKLMNSSESKGNKWTKIKDVMKWLVEQGITVAGIIMPVLTEMMKQ